MKDNVVLGKAFYFAERIYKLHRYLMLEKKEYILARQILRCGTSIGANLEEANAAQTKKDFIAKASISYKEARETSYWLRLIKQVEIIEEQHFYSIHKDCLDLVNLISKILQTAKTSQRDEKKVKPVSKTQ